MSGEGSAGTRSVFHDRKNEGFPQDIRSGRRARNRAAAGCIAVSTSDHIAPNRGFPGHRVTGDRSPSTGRETRPERCPVAVSPEPVHEPESEPGSCGHGRGRGRVHGINATERRCQRGDRDRSGPCVWRPAGRGANAAAQWIGGTRVPSGGALHAGRGDMLTHALALAAAVAASPAPPVLPAKDAGASGDAAARALAALAAGEPTIAAVQAAAVREVERSAPASGFARRSRLAALLPRLTAEYRHDERSYRVVGLQGSGEVDYLRLAPGTAFALRATWDLGGLVAARGEISSASESAERARRRSEAVKRATALFFDRRRALVVLLLDPPLEPRARAEAELEVDRMTAELDALTGGIFAEGRP